MDRPSLVTLAHRLQEARHRYPIGSYWQHLASEDVYQIVDHTIDEGTSAVRLTYRPTKFDHEPTVPLQFPLKDIHFSRPMHEFSDTVYVTRENGGKEAGARFSKVKRGEAWVPWTNLR